MAAITAATIHPRSSIIVRSPSKACSNSSRYLTMPRFPARARQNDIPRVFGPGLPDKESLGEQGLRDLNRVERCALAQVVGDDPELQPAWSAQILADPADEDRILPSALEGRRVEPLTEIVHHLDAWGGF